jgi:hypothetical protein
MCNCTSLRPGSASTPPLNTVAGLPAECPEPASPPLPNPSPLSISSPLLARYDELKSLSCSITPFCPTGADGEHLIAFSAVRLPNPNNAKSMGFEVGMQSDPFLPSMFVALCQFGEFERDSYGLW